MAEFVDLINQIDWEYVQPTHWATRIPELLRDLYFNKQENRDTIETLRTYIAYNVGVYEASIKTIPILIYLLNDKNLAEKRWVLELLFAIRFSTNLSIPIYQEAYNAMYKGCVQIASYINSNNRSERWFVASILAQFVLHRDEVMRILLERLKIEIDPDIIEAIFDSISKLNRYRDDTLNLVDMVTDATDDEKVSQSGFACIMANSTLIMLQRDITSTMSEKMIECIRKNMNELMVADKVALAGLIYEVLENLRSIDAKTKQTFLKKLLGLQLPEVMRNMLQKEFDKGLKS